MAKANEAQSLKDALKAPEPTVGVFEAIKEGIQAVAPGLSLSKIGNDIAAELKQKGAHGAHEIAASLYSGSGFVLYPRTGEAEGPLHGPAVENASHGPLTVDDLRAAAAEKAPEKAADHARTLEQSRERDRGEMER